MAGHRVSKDGAMKFFTDLLKEYLILLLMVFLMDLESLSGVEEKEFEVGRSRSWGGRE